MSLIAQWGAPASMSAAGFMILTWVALDSLIEGGLWKRYRHKARHR